MEEVLYSLIPDIDSVNIILDYKYQLEHREKLNKCLNELLSLDREQYMLSCYFINDYYNINIFEKNISDVIYISNKRTLFKTVINHYPILNKVEIIKYDAFCE